MYDSDRRPKSFQPASKHGVELIHLIEENARICVPVRFSREGAFLCALKNAFLCPK